MRVAWTTLALAGAFLSCASIAAAQVSLTLSEALARARQRAPRIVSARLAIEEARARLLGASHLQSNPEIDLALGNRLGNGARSTDLDLAWVCKWPCAKTQRAPTPHPTFAPMR